MAEKELNDAVAGRSPRALYLKLAACVKVAIAAESCNSKDSFVSSWHSAVHYPLLDLSFDNMRRDKVFVEVT